MKKTIIPDNELIEICKQIKNENKSDKEWDLIEGDDYFQSSNYNGGWDETEQAFCFSYYTSQEEYWFQLTLDQVEQINNNTLNEIILRVPS